MAEHEKLCTLQLRDSFSLELMFFRLIEASSLSCTAAADLFFQTERSISDFAKEYEPPQIQPSSG